MIILLTVCSSAGSSFWPQWIDLRFRVQLESGKRLCSPGWAVSHLLGSQLAGGQSRMALADVPGLFPTGLSSYSRQARLVLKMAGQVSKTEQKHASPFGP